MIERQTENPHWPVPTGNIHKVTTIPGLLFATFPSTLERDTAWRCYDVLFFFPSTLLLHEPGPVDVVTADSVYAGLSPGVLTMFILACSEVGEIHMALSFPFVEVASSRGWVSSCPTGGGRLR